MSNADNSYAARIARKRGELLKSFHAQNPGRSIEQSGNAASPSSAYTATIVGNGLYIRQKEDGVVAEGCCVSSATIVNDRHGFIVIGIYESSDFKIFNADGSLSPLSLPLSDTINAYIVKYNTNGVAIWATHVGGSVNSDISNITTDMYGNCYVCGVYNSNPVNVYNADGTTFISLPNSGLYDVYIVKYNISGNALWATRIAGSGNEFNTGITTDHAGNVYVTGQFSSNPVTFYNANGDPPTINLPFLVLSVDAYIAKYDTDGTALWATRIGGSGVEVGRTIATDTSGNVYASGYYTTNNPVVYNADGTIFPTSLPFSGATDIFLVKYNALGTAQWATHMSGTDVDVSNDITTDTSGNVYITGLYRVTTLTLYNATSGSTQLTNSGSVDTFLVKYNTNGIISWATRIAGSLDDSGYGVITDTFDNVYVTGTYNSNPVTVYNAGNPTGVKTMSCIGSAAYIVKYDMTGIMVWATQIDGSGNEFGSGIAMGIDGYLYVSGSYSSNPVTIYNANDVGILTLNNTGATDTFVVKYDTDGNPIYATSIGGTSNENIRQLAAV